MIRVNGRKIWSVWNLERIIILIAIILTIFTQNGTSNQAKNLNLSHAKLADEGQHTFSSGSKIFSPTKDRESQTENVQVKFLTHVRHRREITDKDFHILEIHRPTSNSTIQIHLVKTHDDLLSHDFRFVVNDGENRTTISKSGGNRIMKEASDSSSLNEENCHYSGHLSGSSGGSSDDAQLGRAVFSSCGDQPGFTGVILSEKLGNFVLEPKSTEIEDFGEEAARDQLEISHTLSPLETQNPEKELARCLGSIDPPDFSVKMDSSTSGFSVQKKSAKKTTTIPKKSRGKPNRALKSGEPVVELAVFGDATFFEVMKKKLKTTSMKIIKNYIITLIHMISILYESKSLKTRVTIRLVSIEIFTKNPATLDTAHGLADRFLWSVCTHSFALIKGGSKWDHAMMFTGIDLRSEDTNAVAGVAFANGMCTPEVSCSLIEGKSYDTAFTGAHELGHSLGMLHDGEGPNVKCDPGSNIMAAVFQPRQVSWSSCSNENIRNFFAHLSTRVDNCLVRNSKLKKGTSSYKFGSKLPGQKISANEQCFAVFGKSWPTPVMDGKGIGMKSFDFCKELYCLSASGHAVVYAHPPLEGTGCASNKWCRRGECVQMSS